MRNGTKRMIGGKLEGMMCKVTLCEGRQERKTDGTTKLFPVTRVLEG